MTAIAAVEDCETEEDVLAALADEFPDSILLDIRRALIAVTTWDHTDERDRRILNGIASALQRLIDRTTMDRLADALCPDR